MAKKVTELSGSSWEKLNDILPDPVDPNANDLLWRQFCVQFAWYDRAANRSRIFHQILDYLALFAGSAVTFLAALSAPAPLTAGVGAVLVMLGGAQKIGQFHANWINYRSAAEHLRQHGFAYAAGIIPYDNPDTRRDRLAEFMHDVLNTEATTWSGTAANATRTTAQ